MVAIRFLISVYHQRDVVASLLDWNFVHDLDGLGCVAVHEQRVLSVVNLITRQINRRDLEEDVVVVLSCNFTVKQVSNV